MRDRLLSMILALEHWIQAKSGTWALLPIRILGYLLLFLCMILSNLLAIIALPILLIASLVRHKTRGPTTDGKPISGNDRDFESLIRSKRPVLVDFWAPWCGPCLMMKPAIDAIALEQANSLQVVTLNISVNSKTAEKYKIQSIPTLVVFRDGQEVQRIVGALNEQRLREFVTESC